MIRSMRFACILLFLALAFGTDCIRLAPINVTTWLRASRDELLATLAAEDVQKFELLCFLGYLVFFLLFRLRKEQVLTLGTITPRHTPGPAVVIFWSLRQTRQPTAKNEE